MKEIEYYEVFNPIIRKINKNEEPPYYYPSVFEFTENNLSEIKIKIYNQILEVFQLENVDKLKEFIDNLNKDKCKLEFNDFIIGGYKTKEKICIVIKTNININ